MLPCPLPLIFTTGVQVAKNTYRQTIAYLYSHIRKYYRSLITIVSFISLATILGQILYPLVYRDLIDTITEFSGTNRSEVYGDLLQLLWFLAGLYLAEVIFWRTAGFTNTHFQPSVMRDINNDIFSRLHKHSIGFFSNNFIGSLVTKSKRLVHGFERIMDILYWEFLTIFITIVFSTIILFTAHTLFGWILLIWAVVFMSGTAAFSIWKMKYDLKAAEADSSVTGSFADSLTNFFNVKVFSHLPYEKKLFQKVTQDQKKIRKLTWDLNEASEIIQALMMLGLEIGTLYFSIQFWLVDRMSVGTLVMINTLNLQITMKVWNFGKRVRDLITAFADCKQMTDLLYLKQEIQNPAEPETIKMNQGKIEFKKVNFYYEKNNPVFTDFDLIIQAGEKIGLVGESGSGKSTFTKLLFRFNDVQSGKILIDRQNIKNVLQEKLKSKIAFVPQEPILFHRSLKENIHYGNLAATDDEILEAARNAHADDFISRTKYGYQTLVGERGIKLSGGEKQRIAIARAMLSKSPILILDEATSALDSKAELKIQEALESLMKNRTTIVIAHRLSTLRRMDRILVLEKGQIIEEGSHQELLDAGGKYAELWNHQVGGFI